MFLAEPEDNNAVYKCEANNIMLQRPLTAEMTMSVQCKILLGSSPSTGVPWDQLPAELGNFENLI